jgi:hypothetical protein
MNPDTRRRLVGVLGLLASNHDGERAAAGLLAMRILKTANVTWESLIPERPLMVRLAAPDWHYEVDYCRQRPTLLTAWEKTFLESLVSQRSLSEKQAAALGTIYHKLRESAGR